MGTLLMTAHGDIIKNAQQRLNHFRIARRTHSRQRAVSLTSNDRAPYRAFPRS